MMDLDPKIGFQGPLLPRGTRCHSTSPKKMSCSGPLRMCCMSGRCCGFQRFIIGRLHIGGMHEYWDRLPLIMRYISTLAKENTNRIGTVRGRSSTTVNTLILFTRLDSRRGVTIGVSRLPSRSRDSGIHGQKGKKRVCVISRVGGRASIRTAVDGTPKMWCHISRVNHGILSRPLLPKSAQKYPPPLSPTSPSPASSS